MDITWITDLHFDHLSRDEFRSLIEQVKDEKSDALLITGDIADGNSIVSVLDHLKDELSLPIYFVLGNHDFYDRSIAHVRDEVGEVVDDHLVYLTQSGVIPLTPQVALVGHDGWADGKAGDYEASQVIFRDYVVIKELMGRTKEKRKEALKELGERAASELRPKLEQALKGASHVIVATHPPPYSEACHFEGAPSTSEWTPHLTCQSIGEMIKEVMASHPDKRVTIYCGHTHHEANIHPASNIEVIVGQAEYGEGKLQPKITLPS